MEPKADSRASLSSASSSPTDARAQERRQQPTQKEEEETFAAGDPSQDTYAQALEEGSGAPVTQIASVNNVASIPNGGLVSWLQVLGAFFLFFNSWGIVNTFGVYQTYYESNLLAKETPSAISWLGSIQAFLLMLVGALTGPIYDAGYFRHLLLAGTFLVVFGHMMLSICETYWQVLLAQGFCVGLGVGCLFVPSVAILSTYFTTRLALAMGTAASGSSLGMCPPNPTTPSSQCYMDGDFANEMQAACSTPSSSTASSPRSASAGPSASSASSP